MSIEFDVKMTTSAMYDYMLRHTFTSFSGIVGVILGIVMVTGYFVTGQWLYLIGGIFVIIYQPASLYLRAKRQVNKNEVFKKPISYRLDDTKITIKSGEDTDSITWDRIYKAVSTNRSIIMYTGSVNACIWPKSDLGDKKDAVISFISTHVDAKRVNIR